MALPTKCNNGLPVRNQESNPNDLIQKVFISFTYRISIYTAKVKSEKKNHLQ